MVLGATPASVGDVDGDGSEEIVLVQVQRVDDLDDAVAALRTAAGNGLPAGLSAHVTGGPAFGADIAGSVLYGRGAVDMKGAIAAFVAAVSEISPADQTGSISFLITGDEEGVAHDGTGKVVAALMAEGERVDHCILGEPTSAARFGTSAAG